MLQVLRELVQAVVALAALALLVLVPRALALKIARAEAKMEAKMA